MKRIIILLLSWAVTTAVSAQKRIDLSLKYDTNFKRYEVYAKPNFTQKNFVWGPSQITIVLPSNILVDKIPIKNMDGGVWGDNSIVQAPEIMPNMSFHGISTTGEKTDLSENFESLLFYFSLPKTLDVNSIRIFNNNKDPKSDKSGMKGGDFSNSIVDMQNTELYGDVYTKEDANKINSDLIKELDLINTKLDVTIYPNVIIDNKFNIVLNGVNDTEGDIILLISNINGKELQRHTGNKTSLEKQTYRLANTYDVSSLVVNIISKKGTINKRLISEN